MFVDRLICQVFYWRWLQENIVFVKTIRLKLDSKQWSIKWGFIVLVIKEHIKVRQKAVVKCLHFSFLCNGILPEKDIQNTKTNLSVQHLSRIYICNEGQNKNSSFIQNLQFCDINMIFCALNFKYIFGYLKVRSKCCCL